MRSIRNSVYVLLLCCIAGLASAQPIITVETKTWGSSTSRNLDHLAIPRHQLYIPPTNNQVVIYGSGGFPSVNTELAFIPDFTATPLTVARCSTSSSSTNNHAHVMGYNDTIVVSHINGDTEKRMTGYRLNGSTIESLYTHIWTPYTTNLLAYVVPVMQVGTTDTFLYVARSTAEPNVRNIMYGRSTDRGRTWTHDIGYALNWSGQSAIIRIGLIRYDNTVALIAYNSTNGIGVAVWDRDTRTWVDKGYAANFATDKYRGVGGNVFMGDTSIMVFNTMDGEGSTNNDYCYTSRRNKGATSWTNNTRFLMSTVAYGAPPYIGTTYIESSKRLVVVYSKNVTGNTNDCQLYFRYWINDSTKWSIEHPIDERLGRGAFSYKMGVSMRTPAAHGDCFYVSYAADSVAGGTTYHLGVLSKISFEEPAPAIEISSLPYEFVTSDTVYELTGDLSSATWAFRIADGLNDVLVEGNGHTVRFGTGNNEYGGSSDYGDSLNAGLWMHRKSAYNVTFRNIKFEYYPNYATTWLDSTWNAWATCVKLGEGMVNLTFDNCTFVTKGRNSKIIWGDNSGDLNYNLLLRNCVFYDSCDAWLNRSMWGQQAMINIQNTNRMLEAYGIPFEYHLKMEGCSTAVAPWANLHFQGDSSVIELYNNAFMSDGYNRLKGTIAGDFDAASENYMVAVRQDETTIPDGHRIKIHNNRFRSGSNHGGSRGIFVSGVEGLSMTHDDSAVTIANNSLWIHQGWDGYYNYAIGILLRDDWGNVRIHNNYLDMPLYVTPPDSSHSDGSASGLRLTPNFGYNLYLKHNDFRVYFMDNFTASYLNGNSGRCGAVIVMDEGDNQSPNMIIDSNTFYTNNMFYQAGWGNGAGGNLTTRYNTYRYMPIGGAWSSGAVAPSTNNFWVWYQGVKGASRLNSFYTYIQDGIFENGISETKHYLSDAEPDSNQVGNTVTFVTTVQDVNNLPVPFATVTIENSYDHTVASGLTDAFGQYSTVIKYADYYNATWDDNVNAPDAVDSTGFNPFHIVATKGADKDSIDATIAWSNKAAVLTLQSGGQPPEVTNRLNFSHLLKMKNRFRIGPRENPGDQIDVVEPEP